MTEQNVFDTAHHRCVFSVMDVQLYNTASLEEDETPDGVLKLPYGEALELARYLLAHQDELEARQAELDAQWTQLSKTLLDLFAGAQQREKETWRGEIVYMPDLPNGLSRPLGAFTQLLSKAYHQLKGQHAMRIRHWCREDEEDEALFWLTFERFFYEHYRDDLIEKFLPEDEGENE